MNQYGGDLAAESTDPTTEMTNIELTDNIVDTTHIGVTPGDTTGWDDTEQHQNIDYAQHTDGQKTEGKVNNMDDFKAFVNTNNGMDGEMMKQHSSVSVDQMYGEYTVGEGREGK